MKPALHMLSIVLTLPRAALAFAFIVLDRAIATQSLLGLLGQLLADAAWIIPWGALGIGAGVLLIALGGLFVQIRWLAGLSVAIVALASAVALLTLGHSDPSLDDVPFFVPGLVAACIGLWFALTERPHGMNVLST